VRDRLV